MTQTVEAASDTRTHADPSANGARTVDYREEAKKLATEDYEARIRRFHGNKASHPIASGRARIGMQDA
jgi:hypothetical protein